MPSALETLVKILKLERQQGCKNTAVIGGLGAFSTNWSKDAHAQARKPEHHLLVDELDELLNRYEALERVDERYNDINYMLDRIMGRVPPPAKYQERLNLLKEEASAAPAPDPAPEPPPAAQSAESGRASAEVDEVDEAAQQSATQAAPEAREAQDPREPREKKKRSKRKKSEARERSKPSQPHNSADTDSDEVGDTPPPPRQSSRQPSSRRGERSATAFERGGDSESIAYDAEFSGRPRGPIKPDIPAPPQLARPPRTPRRPIDPEEAVDTLHGLSASVEKVKGVGAKMAGQLNKLGIRTINDLLFYLPRRYDDYTQMSYISRLAADTTVTVLGTVRSSEVRIARGGRKDFFMVIDDGSAQMGVSFFGQHYLTRQIRTGQQLVLRGTTSMYGNRIQMINPEWESLDVENLKSVGIVPVYALTEGLSGRVLRRLMKRTIEYWADRVPDYIPEATLERADLADLGWTIKNLHFPESWDHLLHAKRRYIFDQLLLLQLTIIENRRTWQAIPAPPLEISTEYLDQFKAAVFPYPLTGAQARCIEDVRRDIAQPIPMNRLLQGDVGSGKTAVAVTALGMAVAAGKQAALMAPTGILAEQHYRNISAALAKMPRSLGVEADAAVHHFDDADNAPMPHPADDFTWPVGADGPPDAVDGAADGLVDRVADLLSFGTAANDHAAPTDDDWPADPPPSAGPTVALLTGSLTNAEREAVYAGLADGSIDVVIGTHALIQGGVEFEDLGLAIIDEQHRFGVEQRGALRSKGTNPHLLVMTATPIPRTLALTIHADLDLSIIDELPPGRQPVKTRVIEPVARERALNFIEAQLEEGRQAFVVYPLVEASATINAEAALDAYERLQKIFYDYNVGLLHGRMKPAEKDKIMAEFSDGVHDVLVTTSVAEVGVDVPNASIIMIEGANRFGLAQLHQFRGRVGRGKHASYCLLVCDSPVAEARERLLAMEQIADGFKLAEIDWRMRGPGDLLGTRQSGQTKLQLVDAMTPDLVEVAQREARALFAEDPDLQLPEHHLLSQRIEMLRNDRSDVS
ncbi:MAG: ATP-dependent DNA helicase RecG [Chloroflexi bacterium]|nr:ATP-dependent DNA helicase RecG [Chloroflexota bacterium]